MLTQIQLKYLAEEMQAINKGLEKVVQELSASENDGPISEIFCKVLHVNQLNLFSFYGFGVIKMIHLLHGFSLKIFRH